MICGRGPISYVIHHELFDIYQELCSQKKKRKSKQFYVPCCRLEPLHTCLKSHEVNLFNLSCPECGSWDLPLHPWSEVLRYVDVMWLFDLIGTEFDWYVIW